MSRTVIGDLPDINARRLPGAPSYVDGDRRFTWSETADRVTRLAHALRSELGLDQGDRVALLADNGVHYVELAFAVSKAKLAYTALNTRHHAREMAYQLADADVRALVVGPGFEELGVNLAGDAGCVTVGLARALGRGTYEELLAAASSQPIGSHEDVDALYALTYTSGTTGEPKGAMISSRNELLYAQSLGWATGTRPDDRHLVVLPLFHRGGQFSTMHPAFHGLPTVILPRPEPQLVLDTVAAERITSFSVVPTVMRMLIQAVEEPTSEVPDLSSLRTVAYGSNPIDEDTLRRFRKHFECGMSQIGGMGTEGGVGLCLSPEDHEACLADPSLAHRLRSCGRVQPGFEVRLVDEDDRDVADGEPGEMLFRGDSFVAGYWRRPEATERVWRGGWFHSGDIGTRDSEGYVYYVDRKAGRIKTGGETVYAREVEKVLLLHPAVADAAVAPVPHEHWGEAVCAAVELQGDATEAELRDHVREHLAGYKVPRRVVVVDALPRTALGKVAIGEVRRLLAAAGTGG